MKVLVVDDSSVMRRILINALNTGGITEVQQAADGSEAVAMCAAEAYDLVLMDWNMPNMRGIDAVRTIRSSGNTVKIMMVTTEAEKSRVIEALKAGANNYVVKPFEPATILEKIQATCAS
ncbi:MAG: response regulator [Fimbriimonadaceae bacterium]|nr:response regulator [Fimbriimonadaceae bacterium]